MPVIKYPEIHLSSKTRNILRSEPLYPEEPIKPLEPIEPVKPEEPSSNFINWIIPVHIGSIIAILITSGEGGGEGVGYAIAVYVFTILLFKLAYSAKKSYDKNYSQYLTDEYKYNDLLKDYKRKYQDYLEEKKEYDRRISIMSDPINIYAYRRRKIKSWLRNRSIPDYMECTDEDLIKKGVAEEYFESILTKEFDEILTDMKIKAGNTYYYPDIILIKDNFYIDIEIDEPYVGSDGTPIHYQNDSNRFITADYKRDLFLTENGWEVIRFAEEQIFRHPGQCVDCIKNVIITLKDGHDSFDIPDYLKLPKWTKEQAYKWAYQRFRQTYVPKRYHKYIAGEIKNDL